MLYSVCIRCDKWKSDCTIETLINKVGRLCSDCKIEITVARKNKPASIIDILSVIDIAIDDEYGAVARN